jgi:hypothetical protein
MFCILSLSWSCKNQLGQQNVTEQEQVTVKDCCNEHQY